LKVWFCNSTSKYVAIAASQMQAKLPDRVKVDKITYWLAYRRVQIEILFVGKEHPFHLINGQTSQKGSASFQPFKFNSIAENLRWHAPKSWQLEIHFRDAPNRSVAHSKRFSNLTGTFARTWLVLLRADHVADSSDVLRSSSWFWPSAARLTSHSRYRLGKLATNRLQSVQTPLLCRIPWSDGLSTKSLFVQSLNGVRPAVRGAASPRGRGAASLFIYTGARSSSKVEFIYRHPWCSHVYLTYFALTVRQGHSPRSQWSCLLSKCNKHKKQVNKLG